MLSTPSKLAALPLWLETQNVTADSNGHYTALLGSTKPDGLPAELFTSEQARWMGVQVSGQPEQPRVLLVSAPYALKAGDAETIGGLPPSAFVMAALPSSASATASGLCTNAAGSASPAAATDVTTTGGTANYLPIFNGASTIIDSVLYQSGTGGTAKTSGANSQPQDFVASSFSSSTSAAVNQTFQWKAEATGNDTATPSGTLNLLFGTISAAASTDRWVCNQRCSEAHSWHPKSPRRCNEHRRWTDRQSVIDAWCGAVFLRRFHRRLELHSFGASDADGVS